MKVLDLSDSCVTKIEGLETLRSLEELHLGYTMSLKELSLVDLSSLRILIVTNSAVQKLVLKNLTGLENLDLSSLTNLTSVRFEGDFTALKSVTFANKEVWEKVEQHSCTWNESITFKCLDSEVEFVGP